MRYHRILGSLQYLTMTQLDISFAVNKLSQFFTNPNLCHWQALQRVLRYVSGQPFLGLLLHPSSSTTVEVFSDVDWVGDALDRRSHGGFVVYYGGNIVSWRLKKQATVARSSTEAEYKSLTDATTEAMWVTEVLHELGAPPSGRSIIWCDSTSAISLSANPVLHNTTKHVAVSFHFVRERVADDGLVVRHVSTKDQQADILTKALQWEAFRHLRSKRMWEIPINLRGGVKPSNFVYNYPK